MKNIYRFAHIAVLIFILSFQSVSGQTCDSSFRFVKTDNAMVDLTPGAGHNFNELYDATNGFTWEAWVYLADTNNLQTVLLGVGDAVVCQDIFVGTGWNGANSKSELFFMLRDNGFCGGVWLSGSTRLMPQTWYYITAVCDYVGGTISLYLDGTNIGSTPITFPPSGRLTRNITTAFGNFSSDNTYSFNGNIDEIKFWSGVRSPSDILNDSVGCTSMPQAGLVAYFKANEGTGTFAASFVNTDFTGNNSAGWGTNAPVSICEPAATITSASTVICNGSTDSVAITVSVSNLPPGSAWSITLSDGSVISGTADASGNGSGSCNVLPGVSTTYTITSITGYLCAVLTGSMDVTLTDCCPCDMRLSEFNSTTNCPAGQINGSFHLNAGTKKVIAVEMSIPYFDYDLTMPPICQFDCRTLLNGRQLGNFVQPNPLAGAPPKFAGCFGKPYAREVDWKYMPGVMIDENVNFHITIPPTPCHINYSYCIKVVVHYDDCTFCECTICVSNDMIVCSCDGTAAKALPADRTTQLTSENVTIYPNPNGGQFTVMMDKTTETKLISVVDMNGKVVSKSIVDGEISKFDISHVPAGVYNVVITSAANVVTRRVVIAK